MYSSGPSLSSKPIDFFGLNLQESLVFAPFLSGLALHVQKSSAHQVNVGVIKRIEACTVIPSALHPK